MKIGCDLDNVAVDIMAGAKAALARDLGIPVTEIIDTHIYWQPFSHLDPAVASKLVPDLTFWDREDVLLGSPPVPGSLEAASSLHEAGLLSCYITRRPPHVAELTLRRSEEHTSELQSLMRISYAVFCLKKKRN